MNTSNAIVLNPNQPALLREVQNVINKYHDYLKSVDTDYRVVRDDEGDIIALAPRIHLVFKDNSDYLYEITTGESASRVH